MVKKVKAVILLQSHPRLGGVGDEVRVRKGFANNYLIPRAIAVSANMGARAAFERRRAEFVAHENERYSLANSLAKRLDQREFIITANSNANGSFYANVKPRHLHAIMEESGYSLALDVLNFEPISTYGVHRVQLRLHRGVECEILINVARTEEEARSQHEASATENAGEVSMSVVPHPDYVWDKDQTSDRRPVRTSAHDWVEALAAAAPLPDPTHAQQAIINLVRYVSGARVNAAKKAIDGRKLWALQQVVHDVMETIDVDTLVSIGAAQNERVEIYCEARHALEIWPEGVITLARAADDLTDWSEADPHLVVTSIGAHAIEAPSVTELKAKNGHQIGVRLSQTFAAPALSKDGHAYFQVSFMMFGEIAARRTFTISAYSPSSALPKSSITPSSKIS